MRMHAWRMSSAGAGRTAPEEVQARIGTFDQSLVLLRDGRSPRAPCLCPGRPTRRRFEAVREASGLAQRPVGPRRHGRGPRALAAQELCRGKSMVREAIEMQTCSLTALLNLFQFSMMALAIMPS
jgi:two-component system nitrate/nitrite sensor histidine kinase NarX